MRKGSTRSTSGRKCRWKRSAPSAPRLQAAIAYQRTSASTFPEVRYNVWPKDAAGPQPSHSLQTGQMPLFDTPDAKDGTVGDLDMINIAPDPDGKTVWIAHPYPFKPANPQTAFQNYGSRSAECAPEPVGAPSIAPCRAVKTEEPWRRRQTRELPGRPRFASRIISKTRQRRIGSASSPTMRWIAVRAPTAAALGAVLLPVALIAPVAAADTPPPVVSRVTVPLAVRVYDPCTAELVALAGSLNLEALAAVLEDGQLTLEFKVQATDVDGSGLSTGAAYRLVGEGHGASTDFAGEDRLVTAADFAVVATANPGTTIGRAQAQPAATIVLRVAISEDGLVERVGAESIVVDQDCA